MKPTIALTATASVLVAVALAGCSSGATLDKSADQIHGNATLPSSESTEEAIVFEEETMHTSPVQVTGTETAVIQTSKGSITLEFYPEDAPNTVASFIELADAASTMASSSIA